MTDNASRAENGRRRTEAAGRLQSRPAGAFRSIFTDMDGVSEAGYLDLLRPLVDTAVATTQERGCDPASEQTWTDVNSLTALMRDLGVTPQVSGASEADFSLRFPKRQHFWACGHATATTTRTSGAIGLVHYARQIPAGYPALTLALAVQENWG